ncbi:MAG: hypothetical protein VYA34_00175 [Myxococcota bacterium]|nr:hypothetical protein [Myxococcota bacterium]
MSPRRKVLGQSAEKAQGLRGPGRKMRKIAGWSLNQPVALSPTHGR